MLDSEDFIKNLISNTVKEFDPYAQIILFGSRARGTARPNSDWDVLVLVDTKSINDEQFEALNYNLWALGLEYGQEINVVLHTKHQWENAHPSLFKSNILHEGIKL